MARKTSERRLTLELGGIAVPVRIITERGRRASIATVRTRALYIRLPHGLDTAVEQQRIGELIDWAKRTAATKPDAFRHFRGPDLAGAYRFSLRGTDYHIEVRAHAAKSHRIERVADGRLLILLCTRVPALKLRRVIPKLLAKYFAGVYLPAVTERVHALNERHFRRPIERVKLSDTYTRWGSCSSLGNINLATRLLLAPDAVLDAVIIHELAHLVEANHSPRFWAQVARALPDYATYDRWLKDKGDALRFNPSPLT